MKAVTFKYLKGCKRASVECHLFILVVIYTPTHPPVLLKSCLLLTLVYCYCHGLNGSDLGACDRYESCFM